MVSRAVLDAVVEIKFPSPRRESNPRTPIVQPVAQSYLKRCPKSYDTFIVLWNQRICMDYENAFDNRYRYTPGSIGSKWNSSKGLAEICQVRPVNTPPPQMCDCIGTIRREIKLALNVDYTVSTFYRRVV
jgi:hypothetical protein